MIAQKNTGILLVRRFINFLIWNCAAKTGVKSHCVFGNFVFVKIVITVCEKQVVSSEKPEDIRALI
jgi:hypothetical protein